METQRSRAIEAFKTLNDLNLNFMKETFCWPSNLTYKNDNLYVQSRNPIKLGNESLTSLEGSEFSSDKIQLRYRVKQNNVTLVTSLNDVTDSNIFAEILFSSY